MAPRKPLRRASALRSLVRGFARNAGEGIAGAAALEFAIIGPTLVLFAVCSADLGLGIYRGMQVRTAARAGAQYAMAHGFVAGSISNAILSATSNPGISASPAPSRFCGCPTGTGISAAPCNSACPGGTTAGTYVTASAQATYRTLLPYPLLPDSFALTAQETVRIQ